MVLRSSCEILCSDFYTKKLKWKKFSRLSVILSVVCSISFIFGFVFMFIYRLKFYIENFQFFFSIHSVLPWDSAFSLNSFIRLDLNKSVFFLYFIFALLFCHRGQPTSVNRNVIVHTWQNALMFDVNRSSENLLDAFRANRLLY